MMSANHERMFFLVKKRQCACWQCACCQCQSNGEVWRNWPPKCLQRSVEWCPCDINEPLFGAYLRRNTYKKCYKLDNTLHFIELQDLRAGLFPSLRNRFVSTMLFICNIQCGSFIFFPHVELLRLAQEITKAIVCTVLELPQDNAKFICLCYKLISLLLGSNHERKGSSENRNTISKNINEARFQKTPKRNTN